MKRFRLSDEQTQLLENAYMKQPYPSQSYREVLAQQIPGYNKRRVQIWFQNKRSKERRLDRTKTFRNVRWERSISPSYSTSPVSPALPSGIRLREPCPYGCYLSNCEHQSKFDAFSNGILKRMPLAGIQARQPSRDFQPGPQLAGNYFKSADAPEGVGCLNPSHCIGCWSWSQAQASFGSSDRMGACRSLSDATTASSPVYMPSYNVPSESSFDGFNPGLSTSSLNSSTSDLVSLGQQQETNNGPQLEMLSRFQVGKPSLPWQMAELDDTASSVGHEQDLPLTFNGSSFSA